jgi:hypothetical protein
MRIICALAPGAILLSLNIVSHAREMSHLDAHEHTVGKAPRISSVPSVDSTDASESSRGAGGSPVVEKVSETMVLSILDGKYSGEIPSMDLFIEAHNVLLPSVGEGLMFEFYRILGDYFSGEGNFSEAGKAYHQALNITDEPEYHLSKFLSVIGVSKRSTPEEITRVLQGRIEITR